MRATRQSEINGGWERPRARPPVGADDGLYRYVPVPSVGRDEDGYPIEDGMSQNVNHQVQTAHWRTVLQRHCPAAMVASDLTMPYERGDKTKVLVPDLVMEMLSESTSEADVGSKRRTYEHIGVRECFLFDPNGFELSTPLVGHRLRGGRYQPVRANAAGRLPSRALGLELHVQGGELRFRDPAAGEDLRNYDAAEDGRVAAEQGRAVEKRRADEAEKGRLAEKRRADSAERELVRLKAARL